MNAMMRLLYTCAALSLRWHHNHTVQRSDCIPGKILTAADDMQCNRLTWSCRGCLSSPFLSRYSMQSLNSHHARGLALIGWPSSNTYREMMLSRCASSLLASWEQTEVRPRFSSLHSCITPQTTLGRQHSFSHIDAMQLPDLG